MRQTTSQREGSHYNLLQRLPQNQGDQDKEHQYTKFVHKSQSAHESPSCLPPLRLQKRSHHTFLSQQDTPLLHRSSGSSKGKLQHRLKTHNQTKKINSKLLNILYLQDIEGINPYIETLHQLYNNPGAYSEAEINQAEELCYIGIGKSVVSENKVSVPPYSRVNLLIREFMIDVINEEIKELQRRHPQRIYIQCNDRALGYSSTLNQDLDKRVSKEEVELVINETNKIIENEFISFKKKKEIEISLEVKVSFWVSLLGIVLLVIYVEVYKSRILMILAWVLIFLGVLLNAVSLIIRERGIHQSQNIIDQIQRKLVDYLNQKNKENQGWKWKCGKDFYWLQISVLKE